MPISTVVSDASSRLEDADLPRIAQRTSAPGSESSAASMTSDRFDDDPSQELQPSLPSVPADELALWFG